MKHFKNLILLIGIIFLSSCGRDKHTIDIDGNIKGLDAKQVYLFRTYPVKSAAIDSAPVKNGHFEFHIHTDTAFEPCLVHINYFDGSGVTQGLGIINPCSPNKSKPDVWADFYMEPGGEVLQGDLSKSKFAGLDLRAGRQNDFYFRNIDLPFTRISRDSVRHNTQVSQIAKLVKENPDAYPAIFALHNFAFHLNNQELSGIYKEFSDDLRQSYYGRRIKEILRVRPDKDAPDPNVDLIDTHGKKMKMIDTGKKLNMIIFWASWCGPCNLEIPSLKKVAAEFHNSNLRMVSVSIDKDKSKWKDAVIRAQMPWQQLAISDQDMTTTVSQYNLDYIPQVFFIDNKRKTIATVNGFDIANEAKFKKILSAVLR